MGPMQAGVLGSPVGVPAMSAWMFGRLAMPLAAVVSHIVPALLHELLGPATNKQANKHKQKKLLERHYFVV